MTKSVLLVIDVLGDLFVNQPLAGRRAGVASAINRLVRTFRENGQPIIWVRQEFRADLSDAFLEMRKKGIPLTIEGTDGARMLPELDVRPGDEVIVKKRYSAFFRTNLDDVLAKVKPDVLVVGGVNTHACIRTTVIDAYQRDYEVVVASDCTASYDEEHHRVTERYLDNKIARFLSNAEIEAMLASKEPGGAGQAGR